MDDTENIRLMLDDLTETAKAWHLRGFCTSDIVAAFAAAGITAMLNAGLGRDGIIEMVDAKLGLVPHVRPLVKA